MSRDITGEEVKALRAACGLDQQEFANGIGVSRHTLMGWERNGTHQLAHMAMLRLLDETLGKAPGDPHPILLDAVRSAMLHIATERPVPVVLDAVRTLTEEE